MPEHRREEPTSASRGIFGTVVKLISGEGSEDRAADPPIEHGLGGDAAEREARRRMRAERRAGRDDDGPADILAGGPPSPSAPGNAAGATRSEAVESDTAGERESDDAREDPPVTGIGENDLPYDETPGDIGAAAEDAGIQEQLRELVDEAHEWRSSVEQRATAGDDQDLATAIDGQLAEAARALEQSLADSERARERWIALEQRLSESLELQRAAAAELDARQSELGAQELEGAELRIRAAEEALAGAERYVQERTELEVRLALLESQRAEIDDELERARQALEEAHRGAEALRSALEERDEELAAERETGALLRDAQDESAARVIELERALTQSRADAGEAAAAAAATLEEVRSAASDEVTRVLDAARGEMERLVQSLATADERGRALEQELTEMRATATRENDRLERQLGVTSASLAKERTALERESSQRQDLEAQLRAVTKQRDEARGEAKRQRADRDALRGRLRALIELPASAAAEGEAADAAGDAGEVNHPAGSGDAGAPADALEGAWAADGVGGVEAAEITPDEDANGVDAPAPPQAPGPAAFAQDVRSPGQAPAEHAPVRSRRRRRRAHDGRATECAVCHRPTGSGPTVALLASGWHIDGSDALCPSCRASGRELPTGSGPGLPGTQGG